MICRRGSDQSDYNSRPHITPGLNGTQGEETLTMFSKTNATLFNSLLWEKKVSIVYFLIPKKDDNMFCVLLNLNIHYIFSVLVSVRTGRVTSLPAPSV